MWFCNKTDKVDISLFVARSITGFRFHHLKDGKHIEECTYLSYVSETPIIGRDTRGAKFSRCEQTIFTDGTPAKFSTQYDQISLEFLGLWNYSKIQYINIIPMSKVRRILDNVRNRKS